MDTRLTAAESGNTKYEGSACKRCQGTARWVINATCVACSNKAATQRNRNRRELLRNALKAAREKNL